MANRHLARSVVVQTLFECDFSSLSVKDSEKTLDRNIKEFAPGLEGNNFAHKLLKGVLEKQSDLDQILTKAAPEWPVSKIAPIDRVSLRLGLYELLFSDRQEVPPKVAINESIELAKTFGGENSGKFVNGVLGSIYKELGEPEKDAPKAVHKKSEIPYTQLPVHHLGGAVVYAKQGEDLYLALVHDVFGHWTLSKGGIIDGEDVETGTKREIKEELGLDIVLKENLGENEYPAKDPDKGKIRKRVNYFLAEAPFQDLKLGSSGGLDDAKWFKLQDILDLNFYKDILPIVTKAINILLKK